MVIWVIGLSASGKTTIGKQMLTRLQSQPKSKPWVFLDGDDLRQIMGEDLGHSVEDRKKNAERFRQICSYLDGQGINVLACILSIFPEHQEQNREQFSDYRELYIKVEQDVLKCRDNKELYVRAEKGEIDDVVGVQIPFPEPKNADFILENNDDDVSVSDLADKALSGLGVDTKVRYSYADDDLLGKAFKYQYLPFEGRDFLTAYRESREQAVSALSLKLSEMLKCVNVDDLSEAEDLLFVSKQFLATDSEQCAPALAAELNPETYEQHFFEGQNLEGRFVTRHFLLQAHRDLDDDKWDDLMMDKTVLRLIQRFEVSKKVFTTYRSQDLRKFDNDFSDMLNFSLFHLLLTRLAKRKDATTSLIYQNSLLKLGDILSACQDRFVSIGQVALAITALKAELELMQEVQNV